MAIREPLAGQQETAQTCFLCALDPAAQPCALPRLEGLLIAAHETQIDGEVVPWVTLRCGEQYASITLTRSYRELVRGLRALDGPLADHQLTLRVYHLPPVTQTTIHKEIGRASCRERV